MKTRRITAGAAVTAAAALVLAACNGGPGDDPTDGDTTDPDDPGIITEQTVNVGWNQGFYEYNSNSPTGNAVANSNVLYLMNGGFRYYDADLNLLRDESYGTFEVVNDDPLRVQFTIADGVEWSDGTAVDAADLLLPWAAHSGYRQTVEHAEVERDPETGEVIDEGGIAEEIYWGPVSSSFALIENVPEISEDGQSVTIEYSVPFVDWEYTYGVGVPAHVVAMRALDIDDPAEAKERLITAIQDNVTEDLAPMSAFWRTGFQFADSLPDDELLYLSNGAYLMTGFSRDQYVELTANPDYTGDRPASIENITFRYNESPLAQVQALENGDVHIIYPQATPDVIERLEELGDAFGIITGDGATYEHVDLAFNNFGPFDPRTYDPAIEEDDEEAEPSEEAVQTALQVRQAFLNLIPREQIVELLIRPLNPEAVVRHSFTQVPGSPGYDTVLATSGLDTEYPVETDLDAAVALLDEAGVETPIPVRFMYASNNERRQSQYALIQESVEREGLFELVDVGSTEWGTLLSDSNNYDASLFGWQSSSTAVGGSAANFITGGGNNYGGYSNARVDELFTELQTEIDAERQIEILAEVEEHLVADAFGTTIFQFPEVAAYSTQLQNVNPIPLLPTIFWNYWEWEFTPEG